MLKATSEPLDHAAMLEREAARLLSAKKIEEAFRAYDEAGSLYQEAGEHLKAALCFSSAASCWNLRSGLHPLRNAASRNTLAAREAVKSYHYDYARTLFREAAVLYEREGDFENYSVCFWESQLADARRSWEIFVKGRAEKGLNPILEGVGVRDRTRAFVRWFLNHLSRIVWGYGERPFRTTLSAAAVIGMSAFFYWTSDQILVGGTSLPGSVSFLESLYLSVITFSTVGYGDYLPAGWVRFVSAGEALLGIVLTPLFLVGLTRQFLRMYR